MKNKQRRYPCRSSVQDSGPWLRWLGVVALACGASEVDSPSSSAPPPFTTGGTGFVLPGNPASNVPTALPVGAEGPNSGGTGSGNERPVMPVGLDGAAGSSSGSSTGGPASNPVTGAGGAGQDIGEGEGGQGGMEPTGEGDCNNPPAPSRLEGWAAVAGRGVDTTTGGGNAPLQVVTDLAALQAAVAGTNAAVIGVRGNMAPGDVRIGSNKTIVGLCGAQIHGHVEINGSINVIVRNIEIVGFSPGNCALDPGFDAAVGCSSGDDAVIIQRDSHHVWFDHCIVRDGTDGNLDISNGADFVTISFTKFMYTPRTDDVGSDSTGAAGHRYSNLVGGTDEPDDFDDANSLNVTWHHNWWADNVVERQPRIRFGQNHLYNNYYNSQTANYCVRAGIESNILLEGNYFDGVDDPHEFNSADDQGTANITAGNSNIYDSTTSDQATGGGGQPFTDPPYDYVLDDAAGIPATLTNAATGAGPH